MIRKSLNIKHYCFDFFENRKLPKFRISISSKYGVELSCNELIKAPIIPLYLILNKN